jgi:hypothetical protein
VWPVGCHWHFVILARFKNHDDGFFPGGDHAGANGCGRAEEARAGWWRRCAIENCAETRTVLSSTLANQAA